MQIQNFECSPSDSLISSVICKSDLRSLPKRRTADCGSTLWVGVIGIKDVIMLNPPPSLLNSSSLYLGNVFSLGPDGLPVGSGLA